MKDMVVPDVMNDVFLPQGRYLENFMLISQLEVGQEGGGQEGGYLEVRVILNNMDDLGRPQGSYPESNSGDRNISDI